MSAPHWDTIPEMVQAQTQKLGNRSALLSKKAGRYQSLSWNGLSVQVEELALGLLDFEIQVGDRVAILSPNRPEWAISDLAILSLGAVTVPIYTTLTTNEIEYILKDSEAKLVFVSDPDLMANVLPLQETMDFKIVLFDAPYRASGPRIWWFGELLGLGKTAGPGHKEDLAKRRKALQKDDLASIIYTSGTTGTPKGVCLTHDNFLSNCRAVQAGLPLSEEDLTLSFLPLSHVFERMAGYYFVLFCGAQIAYAENIDTVPKNLLEANPTVVTGVPRFYEKFYERLQETLRQAPKARQKIFKWAIKVGKKTAPYREAQKRIPLGLKLKTRLADKLVFSQLRKRLGGNLRFFVSGGAPLRADIAEFFFAAGIIILEGYGLTETSPVIAMNRLNKFRFGTVGLPVSDIEVRIAEDGEILTRGPHVMQGYFNKPDATKEVLNAEGWFHTGDVGEFDDDGFLRITDRKKDLIKTSGGKMVAPQHLEALLKASPWIDDCVVIGDQRKYLTALLVPNLDMATDFARNNQLAGNTLDILIKEQRIFDQIWAIVESVNEQLASFEQLKKVTLLSDAFAMGEELTPTLKVKRSVIEKRYADIIDAMYPAQS